MIARGRISVLVAVAAALGAMLVAAPTAAATPASCTWKATAQPVPDGYRQITFGGGDGAGQVAGYADPVKFELLTEGAIWRNGQLSLVGHAFGKKTELTDINRSGTAVGQYWDEHEFGVPTPYHAVRYVNGQFERLPDPAGYTVSGAVAVNERGDVFGTVAVDGPTSAAQDLVVWPADAPGTVKFVPRPHAGAVFPGGIDDSGDVSWGMIDPGSVFGGYVWTKDGVVHSLDRVDKGDSVGGQLSAGGRVVGEEDDGHLKKFAVEWNLDGTVRRTVPGLSTAKAMNAGGSILGTTGDGTVAIASGDGGPVQPVTSPGHGYINLSEFTDDNVIYGEWSGAATVWRCS